MARKIGENGMQISKSKLFWRTQRECWRRVLTPYVMYLFMSMMLLATELITTEGLEWLKILLGIICIAIGIFFNGLLAYTAGIQHYDALITGNLHRKNIEEGIASGGDHRLELEYSPWKGFYIGFLLGLPVILLAGLACIPGAISEEASTIGGLMLLMFGGYALVPVTWCYGGGAIPEGGYAWAMLFVIVNVVVTGVFYIVGANVNRKRREAKALQQEEALKAKNAPKEYREQTEEQKRKTQQSKKKKK